MLTFDNFKQVFTKAKKPFWILYKGTGTTNQIASRLDDEGEDTNILASLERLEEVILLYGDGVYTVSCRSSKTASRGNDTHTFLFGEAPSKTTVSGTSAPAPAAHPASSFFSGLDARYFLEQSASLQNQLNAAQMEILKKEMQLQMLKQEAKAEAEKDKGSIAGFLEKNPSIVRDLIGMVSGAQPSRVGVLRTDQPIPNPVQPIGNPVAIEADSDDDNDDEGEDYEPGKVDFNALFDCAVRLQRAIPNMHVNELLDRLTEFAEDKPDQVQFLLTQL